MILSNSAKCLKCGDEIFSASRHDYQTCSCSEIFVDGGMSYIRHGYLHKENYMNLSIEISELDLQMCLSALDWCDDPEAPRNNLGKVCAIFRALRDSGYINKEMK